MTPNPPPQGFMGVFFLDGRPGPISLAPATAVAPTGGEHAGLVVACDARIDNRTELGTALGMSPSMAVSLSEPALIARIYREWGEECAIRLTGDFAFAVWIPRRSIFSARAIMSASGLSTTTSSRDVTWCSDPISGSSWTGQRCHDG